MNRLMDKYRSLSQTVKASLWFLVCGILQRGISVITTPIFTRLLTNAEYGQFSVFLSWQGILTIFVTLNLSYGVYTQGLVKFDHDRSNFSAALHGLSLVLTVVFFGIYMVGRSFWNDLLNLSTLLIICMFISMWCNAEFSFWAARERVDFQYKKLVALTIIVSVAKPLFGVLSVVLVPNARVEARIISLTVVEMLFYGVLFVRQLRDNVRFFDKEYWKYGLKFNLPLVPHYLSQTVLNSSDRIMIGQMCSEADAGIYSLAYSLSMLMSIVNTAINNTLSPWLYKQIKAKDFSKIASITYSLLVLIAVSNLFVILLAPEIVFIFAPKSYYSAIWAIPPVTMSVFFMFMYSLFANFSFYFEKTNYVMYASVGGAALNLVLNALFIPVFGFIAAAYTTLFCYMVYGFCHYIFMRVTCKKYVGRQNVYDVRIILGISLVFTVSGFALMLIYDYPIIRYVLTAVVLFILFKLKDKIINAIKSIRT